MKREQWLAYPGFPEQDRAIAETFVEVRQAAEVRQRCPGLL